MKREFYIVQFLNIIDYLRHIHVSLYTLKVEFGIYKPIEKGIKYDRIT